MTHRFITDEILKAFCDALLSDERSKLTIEKYHRDVKKFAQFAGAEPITRELVLRYKADLESGYAVSSANSMIASVNSFFRFMGWQDLCVRQFKMQRKTFCSEDRELTRQEYNRLVNTAETCGRHRLASEIMDRDTSSGVSILQQDDDAMVMFHRYYQYEKIDGMLRKTVDIVPENAFREAIANALVHRTWDIDSHIRVLMFADHIEIISPGGAAQRHHGAGVCLWLYLKSQESHCGKCPFQAALY